MIILMISFYFKEDSEFLKLLFRQLADDETDDDKRRDLLLFLKEFCTFSQTLAQQNKEAFFKVCLTLCMPFTLSWGQSVVLLLILSGDVKTV